MPPTRQTWPPLCLCIPLLAGGGFSVVSVALFCFCFHYNFEQIQTHGISDWFPYSSAIACVSVGGSAISGGRQTLTVCLIWGWFISFQKDKRLLYLRTVMLLNSCWFWNHRFSVSQFDSLQLIFSLQNISDWKWHWKTALKIVENINCWKY